jgi:23S rRNA C2498 (ribose-2'-O)-methylase RlmM
MKTNEIIQEIQKLPIQKRIFVIEKAIQTLRRQSNTNQMNLAADDLFAEYHSNKELTVFTNLDFEDFYEAR